MKKFKLAALASFTLSTAIPHAHASTFAPVLSSQEGVAAGLQIMQWNTSTLRNTADILSRARDGYQLAEVNVELIRKHERAFSTRPDYFKRTLDRGNRYLFHIMNEVEKRGLPTEVALLPFIESAFVPIAKSPVGAAGLWQFMPATGRHFKLDQNHLYDERRDVLESTTAALNYLEYLHGLFGNWSFAFAAYNWGEGNVKKAIARNKAAGLPITYESLRMPEETRNYVPKLLAVRNLLANPQKFSLSLPKLANTPHFVAISTNQHLDLNTAAKWAEMSLNEFKELNPTFNVPVYTHKAGRKLLIPTHKLATFEANLSKQGSALPQWQLYTPNSNTSASQLASQFQMDTSVLMSANGNRTQFNAGTSVLVATAKTLPLQIQVPRLAQSYTAPANTYVNPAVFNTVKPSQVALLPNTKPAVVSVTPAPAPAPAVVSTTQIATLAIVKPMTAPVITPIANTTQVAAIAPKPVIVPTPAPIKVSPAPMVQIAQTSTPSVNTASIESDIDSLLSTIDLDEQPESSIQALIDPPSVNPIAAVSVAAPVAIPAANLPVSRNGIHIVAVNDTLYNIAKRYNIKPKDLQVLNQLQDSTIIKLNQKLKVPVLDANAPQISTLADVSGAS